jgi:hypothetical protein
MAHSVERRPLSGAKQTDLPAVGDRGKVPDAEVLAEGADSQQRRRALSLSKARLLLDHAARYIFHAKLHQLFNEFRIVNPDMLRGEGEILILGDLGVGVGLQ